MPNNSSSPGLKWAAVLVVVVAAGAAGVYSARPVAKVTPVTAGPAASAVPGSVTVAADFHEIKCEIGGRIVRSVLKPGLTVKPGDFLVQIDPADLDLEIAGIQGELDALTKRIQIGSTYKFAVDNARDDLRIKERSFNLGTLAQEELNRQKREVERLEQQLRLEEAANEQRRVELDHNLQLKRRQRDKMTVTAPADGEIAEVFSLPNALIGNNTTLAKLVSITRRVEAKISEENAANVGVGKKALVRFLSYGGKTFDATVLNKLPAADPETQRYTVLLEVKIAPELLVPGLTGEVSIVLGERNSATNVPRRALRGTQLFVVRDGRVEARTVKLGYTSLTDVEVLAGVKPGEFVIIDDLDQFRDGQRVRSEVIKL